MVNTKSISTLLHRKIRKIITVRAAPEAQKRAMEDTSVEEDKYNKLACTSDQFSYW